jgi:hypothetical protein
MMTKLVAILAIVLGLSPFLMLLLSRVSVRANISLHRNLTAKNILLLEFGGLIAVMAGIALLLGNQPLTWFTFILLIITAAWFEWVV